MNELGDPTELAGMAEVGTESITAWSLKDDTDEDTAPCPCDLTQLMRRGRA